MNTNQFKREDWATKSPVNGRTPEEQLAHLDELYGKGQGAVKERAKLKKRIADREVLKAEAAKAKEKKAKNKKKEG